MKDVGPRQRRWLVQEGPWWLLSVGVHAALLATLGLLSAAFISKVETSHIAQEAPAFDAVASSQDEGLPPEIERFELGETPEEPTELTTDTLLLEKPAQMAQAAEFNDQSKVFKPRGGGTPGPSLSDAPGLGGFDIKGLGSGPAIQRRGGAGHGIGSGLQPGTGGDGMGFGTRGSGSRKAMVASGGGTRQSERVVAGALNWLARHQLPGGSWGLAQFRKRCRDATCTGSSRADNRPAAATALALLPFLAAGQTHESRGPYRRTIGSGMMFLVNNQRPNGDLRMGSDMYDHGLATITLCECYGMTGAKNIKNAARKAIQFIIEAQDPKGGGWRYEPRQHPGDLSVSGWQVMALKSGQMAGLNVDPKVFQRAQAFVKSCTFADHEGRFTYMPGLQLENSEDYERATTAIGLLCHQYIGMDRTNPVMIAGTNFLMQNPPPNGIRNLYYWYYATQVMHNQPGPQWDKWNRAMRKYLIDTQCREGCATGSWDPNRPTKDIWGEAGGRLTMTSLAALTLEVYYRYLPLYKLDRERN